MRAPMAFSLSSRHPPLKSHEPRVSLGTRRASAGQVTLGATSAAARSAVSSAARPAASLLSSKSAILSSSRGDVDAGRVPRCFQCLIWFSRMALLLSFLLLLAICVVSNVESMGDHLDSPVDKVVLPAVESAAKPQGWRKIFHHLFPSHLPPPSAPTLNPSPRLPPHSPPPEYDGHSPRVAVCMVGAARDFEITGPSIMTRLLTSYKYMDVFLHAPLDEGSFKFWILKDAASLAAVRIFPNTWVNETDFPSAILKDETSPMGLQGLFQYFRLIEGCIPLIHLHQKRQNFTYDWILRIRVDSFWSAPLPPLSSFPPSSYAIPFGTDCGGLNDRGGMGTWQTSLSALARLSLLRTFDAPVLRNLNSHRALLAQMVLTNTSVTRVDFPFCIVTRRIYLHNEMLIAAMTTPSPLNGAKCRPCLPKLEGKKARLKHAEYPVGAQIKRIVKGLKLCDASRRWEKNWDQIFDRTMGEDLAMKRRITVNLKLKKCLLVMEMMRDKAQLWGSPSPEAICIRRELGAAYRLGKEGSSYATFLDVLNSESLLISTSVKKHENDDWENEFSIAMPTSSISKLSITNLPHRKIDILKLRIEGSDLEGVKSWIQRKRAPVICQLLVSFPARYMLELAMSREDFVEGLSSILFQLDSCIQEPYAIFERCTFYSLTHCVDIPT